MRKLDKVTAAIAGGALVVVTAGTAYAYWTTSGSGNGSARVAETNAAPVMTLTGQPVTGMVPGLPVEIKVDVANPATYSQSAGAVTGVPKYNNASTSPCDQANWSYTPAAVAPVVGPLAAGGTKTVTVGTLTLLDKNNVNQDSCKGVTLSFDFTAATPTS